MKKSKSTEVQKLLKINLGIQPMEGFEKISFSPFKFPWPLKDESVEELVSPMQLNYVPAEDRGEYMDEIYRILIPNGTARIWVPYYTSARATQDYAAQWPPFSENSFQYFNREWRKINHPERTLKCNFDFTFGYIADPETGNKNDETRTFHIKHYVNTVLDLAVVLVKKP